MTALGKVRVAALVGLTAMMVALVAACGGADPTATPQAQATPTPVGPGQTEPTATPAPSFDAAGYFRGKTIRYVVGYSPGGGTDASARYMAQEWPKFIPGNPRIVVSNLVPAPAEMNFLWDASSDGLTLAMDATAAITQSYLPQSRYQVPEFGILAGFDIGDAAWLIAGNAPYNDIRDAMGSDAFKIVSPVSASQASELTTFDQMIVLLAHWMDLPLELVTIANANSTAVRFLSMERGETTSIVSNLQWARLPQLQPDWLEQGRIKLFADLSNPNVPFPGNSVVPASEITVPNVYTLLTPEQQPLWTAVNGPSTMYSKGVFTTRNTDQAIIEAYRAAWDAASADPAFMEGMNRVIGGEVQSYTGAQTEEIVHSVATAYDTYRDEVAALLNEVAPNYFRN